MPDQSYNFTFDSAKLLGEVADFHRRRVTPTGTPGMTPGVLVPFQFRRFELAYPLIPNTDHIATTTLAWPLLWSPDQATYVADDSSATNQFIIADVTGSRWGWARDSSTSPPIQGCRGICMKPHDVDIATGGDRWEIVEITGWGTSSLIWAKAQYHWQENGGDPKVSVKRCKRDGSVVVGDAFDVYLPRLRAITFDLDPSVYLSDVICCEIDNEGTPICQSPYLWSKIGDFNWQNVLDRIPTGWEEYLPAKHRVLMARDIGGVAGETAPDLTGGFRWHGWTENNHPLHDTHATHATHSNHDDHAGHDDHDAHADHDLTVSFGHDMDDSGAADYVDGDFDEGQNLLEHSAHSSHSAHDSHSGHDAHDAHDTHSDHTGPYNNEYDTDNRPPWIVEVLIRRTF